VSHFKENNASGVFWASEVQTENLKLSFACTEKLYEMQSDFQKVTFVTTEQYGRMLLLDDMVMTTEKDEFFYHEQLVHPAMHLLPDAKKVLVIGGGDGGTVRELAKYSQLEEITLCEIDGAVIEFSRKYLPTIGCGFDSSKVKVIVGDGAKYVRDSKETYDLILLDGSDPVGPAEVLFETSFIAALKDRLSPNGLLATQSGTALLNPEQLKKNYTSYQAVFPYVTILTGPCPTYPCGTWTFLMASPNPKELEERIIPTAQKYLFKEPLVSTRYFQTSLLAVLPQMPNYIKKQVSEGTL